jgi:UDP-glucuronate 4-epimerase
MTVLLTGMAGFIGYHAAHRLAAEGRRVIGVDNLSPYYSPQLKRARLARLLAHPRLQFIEADLADVGQAQAIFSRERYDLVLHLAAQPGVRYGLDYPQAYAHSNITAFLNVLEGCRHGKIPRLIYASSSSVYGGNTKLPFAVGDPVDTPVSLYAATKRANELMAHSYTHLFGFSTTGLRFFTVYGPWGRPDMAPFRFASAMDRGRRIDIYNYGRMQRDFTYIDDVVEGLVRTLDRPHAGSRLYNIGNAEPVPLLDFVHAMEQAFGKRARRRYLPLQPGDVIATHADVEAFALYTGFRPRTPIAEGVAQFVDWYRAYYGRAQQDDSLTSVAPPPLARAMTSVQRR